MHHTPVFDTVDICRADDAIKAHPPVVSSSPEDRPKERGKTGEVCSVLQILSISVVCS